METLENTGAFRRTRLNKNKNANQEATTSGYDIFLTFLSNHKMSSSNFAIFSGTMH